MDALTQILDHCRMRATVFSRAALRAPFAVATRGAATGLFHAVVSGTATLVVPGRPPHLMGVGDVVILPRGAGHVLCDDPRTEPVPIAGRVVVEEGDRVGMLRLGPEHGPLTRILCGSVHLDLGPAHPLLGALPEVVVVPRGSGDEAAWLDATVRLIDLELGSPRPGADAVITRLADVLLIGALRAYIQGGALDGLGGLAALRDGRLARALEAVHRSPAADLGVDALAARAGMSRTAFYGLFSRLVGEPPSRYVTRWRMYLAGRYLAEDGLSVAEAAERVGYGSEFAFAKAFKRHHGRPPGAWRRGGSPGWTGAQPLEAPAAAPW